MAVTHGDDAVAIGPRTWHVARLAPHLTTNTAHDDKKRYPGVLNDC
jgi:hypothetical protein